MHANKRFVIRVEHRALCCDAINWVRAIEHDDCNATSFASAHAKIHRPDERVVTRANVLEIDEQNIEPFQHLRGRPSMLAIQTVNRNAKTRMLVALPLHHVVLGLAKKSVLRTKKRHKTKKITVMSL